jgi:RNA polymerase sigma-54 factor
MYQQQAAKMHMTPQLRQAIRILQLSTPELWEYVREQLQDNPLLESRGVEGYSHYRSYDPLLHAQSHEPSLETHLTEQLTFTPNIPDSLKTIILYMIGNLDGNGYLELSLGQIINDLNVELGQAERALTILQGFDPAGIAARNVKECLLLQVKAMPRHPPILPLLITDYLEDVANHRIHKLSAAMKVSQEAVEQAIELIKGLNPRPGAVYQPAVTPYIIPDVIIEKDEEHFVVSIHEAALPRLSINGHYQRMAKKIESKEARQFLHERMNSAVFFIKCLEQRRSTLLRVTKAIVEEQVEFFREGLAGLKPMILRQIADKLSVHESTVSRATSGKYAQTPWGIFELAFFFPSGFHSDIQHAVSAENVKQSIRERILQEDGSKPYSDQQLAEMLLAEGTRISRRTVAQYRDQLGIGSSVKRKR